MRTIDGVRRSVVAIEPERTVTEAARLMNHAGVGCLAVVDGTRLVGVVTDRDLVRKVLAPGLPADARVDSVMTLAPITVEASADLHDVFAVFRSHGIRRLPVVDQGRLVGVISIDDLLVELAADLADLARPVTGEMLFPHREMMTDPVKATP